MTTKTTPDPVADLNRALRSVTRTISRWAGPRGLPVDLTLASAALNCGECPYGDLGEAVIASQVAGTYTDLPAGC